PGAGRRTSRRPHPGGGGETYVDLLQGMPGFTSDRLYLSPTPEPGPAVARGALAALRAGVAYDLIHVEGEVASGLRMPLLAAPPLVVTLNGLHLVRRLSRSRRSLAALNLRLVVRAAGRTICVSDAEYRELSAAIGPAASRRAVVVRNGVTLPAPAVAAERASSRAELGLAVDEAVGIWIGSLDDHKDPLTAVRAAAAASIALVVVGDGPLRGEIERVARERT